MALILTPGTVPGDVAFPASVQGLLNLIASYLSVTGAEDLTGAVVSATEPAIDDRDKLWGKLDAGTGKLLGVYAWSGTAWEQSPTFVGGPTADRPTGSVGKLYFDTTINVLLVWERGQWRTAAGSPGDVKFVKTSTLEEALTRNPGWVQDPDSMGRVVGAAGAGSGLTDRAYGAAVGVEEVTLTAAQSGLPQHSHTIQHGSGFVNNTANPGSSSSPNGAYPTLTTSTAGPANAQSPHTNMQPSIFYWALVKQ